jgi:signal transduction histidine kinase
MYSFSEIKQATQAATPVSTLLPAGAARQTLDSAIDQAAQAIAEGGRDALQGSRSSKVGAKDLAFAIKSLGDNLAARETSPNSAVFHVWVAGTPQDLHPLMREEVYRIAAEALRNAFRHAQAKQIEVEIRYDERQFRMRVWDDGKGIDSKRLNEDGWSERYGLRDMRARAESMGGKLTVWSKLHLGTELELRISTANPYSASPAPHRSWFDWKLRFAAIQGHRS